MSSANFGGKIGDLNSYVKVFNPGTPINLWKVSVYNLIPVITTSIEYVKNVLIQGDLTVDGGIFNPSDKNLKDNVNEIDSETTNKIMNLKPSKFTFKRDTNRHTHYGFIAQELEEEYPELISIKPVSNMANLKSVNYLEIIPLLVDKIQMMQKEIDELKLEIRGNK